MKFSDLGLAEPFYRAVHDLGYEVATPIQAQAIPVILEGRDLVGCAQTGTGKTAAFTLPMLDRLVQSLQPQYDADDNLVTPPPAPPKGQRGDRGERGDSSGKGGRPPKGAHPKPRPIRALVLAPTRELAAQIGASLNRYGKHTALRNAVIFGGVSQVPQVKALRHGVDALVATPGRLIDLMDQGYVDLSRVEVLVFDEADQMLDMGFLPDLRRIERVVPPKRQTLMFSATMPDAIRELAQKWLRDPASVQVVPVATPAERITQSVHFVDQKRKTDLLAHLLHTTPRGRTLVFSRTKHGADKIVKQLDRQGLRAEAIHGNKSQNARNRALEAFKGKNPPVLVATDIAARGLDIREVTHVVNFDLPETPETYVHRIGRTARAGAEGVAVSFCAGDEHALLRQIERLTSRSIPVEPTVEGFTPTDPITDAPRKPGGQRGQRPAGGGSRGGRPKSAGDGPKPESKRRRPKGAGPGRRKPVAATSSSGATGSKGSAGSKPAGAQAVAPAKRKKRHRSAV